MPTLPPIRIAIVGTGLFAEDAHVPSLLGLADTYRIVAVCGRTALGTEKLARLIPYAVDLATDLPSVLARPDIDAVDLVLPISAMASALEMSLASGKHVFSEKPLATDVASGLRLLEIHRRHPGQIWMVGENWRYEPAFVAAADLVSSGAIGQPRVCDWVNYSPMRPTDRYYRTAWRRSGDFPGGLLLDGGVHHVAVLRMIVGEIVSVSSVIAQHRSDLPPADTLSATLQFERGTVGAYVASYAYEAPWSSGLRIVGDAGTILVDTKRLELTNGSKKSQMDFESAYFGVRDEFEAFANSVRGVSPHKNTAVEALRDVAVVEAMLEASTIGRPVASM